MCEINPKRKVFFRLEFFTAHDISNEAWMTEVLSRLVQLEREFNESGIVRVHVHHEDSDGN